MAPKDEKSKKLFLVDATAHIYRAFYALMVRMNVPEWIPTKSAVALEIRGALIKDYQPEFLGIVFYTNKPTFCDNSSKPTKRSARLSAGRNESATAICPAAVRSDAPTHSGAGWLRSRPGRYPHDGQKGAAKKLEVLVISNDKDMMNFVKSRSADTAYGIGREGRRDRRCAEGRGNPGCAAWKVIDLMALLGAVPRYPLGRKECRGKGATELIQKFTAWKARSIVPAKWQTRGIAKPSSSSEIK